MSKSFKKIVAVIVAHPDDEILWAGGTILSHPSWECFIICLCRGSDQERAAKFYKTLKALHSDGMMGDLDDGPDQSPLVEKDIVYAILDMLPPKHFDLMITHDPSGEYTRHIRHEEVSKAVINLWHTIKISANELWTFAYEDGNKAYYPRAVENAPIYQVLTNTIWLKKYNIITKIYGFEKNSWEAETTTKSEAFRKYTNPSEAKKRLSQLTKDASTASFLSPSDHQIHTSTN